jgi:NAD(P)-dependent dehydrogenase (short-subunit alcohol dehydrogenase family)
LLAVLDAREGADVAIVYLPPEQCDADETKQAAEAEGRRCLLVSGDITQSKFCHDAVARTVKEFGKLDTCSTFCADNLRTERTVARTST